MSALGLAEKLLFGADMDEGATSRVYAWNLAASIAYSAQSALLLLVVTRFGGLAAAGRFSIYFITTTMLAAVGNYSMRNYQVSDARGDFAYGTYLASRVVTCALMMLMCLGYALIWQASYEGVTAVMLLGVYRATDAVEDVIHGEVQRCGRLDAASIAKTVRISAAFAAFTVTYALTVDMTAALAAMSLCSAAVLFASWPAFKDVFPQLGSRLLFRGIDRLLAACLPICASAVLYGFIANLPRYAIEAAMASELQGIFNILFMPVFVIDMLSMVVFEPVVADLGRCWQEGDLRTFGRTAAKQLGVIAALTVLCTVVGGLIGCPVLGAVFGTDLSGWEALLAALLALGGISALASFVVVLLTVMRSQAFILVGYLAAVLLSPLYLGPLVGAYGLYGAGLSYGILTGTSLLVFAAAAATAAARRARSA